MDMTYTAKGVSSPQDVGHHMYAPKRPEKIYPGIQARTM